MKYEQKKFTEVVKKSHNLTDLCKNIGLKPYCGNRQTVKKYIAMYNLDIEIHNGSKRCLKCSNTDCYFLFTYHTSDMLNFKKSLFIFRKVIKKFNHKFIYFYIYYNEVY